MLKENPDRKKKVNDVLKKTNDDLLGSVKSSFKEAKKEIPETVIDHAYRIGSSYLGASPNKNYKSIIIHFIIFRHRTMF